MATGKESILRAAEDLFGAHGFDRISVRDIAEEAGVNKALVFYHFNSKDELFETVLLKYFADHRCALEKAWSQQGTVRQRLHSVIDAYVDFIVEHHAWPRLVQQISSTQHKKFLPIVQEGLLPLVRWTEDALEGVTQADGPCSAYHFFETFAGSVIHHFTHAPVLAPLWDETPMAPAVIEERRQHLHWLVDVLLEALEKANSPASTHNSSEPE
jgi:TetR/AcrR family transcriptional regulator